MDIYNIEIKDLDNFENIEKLQFPEEIENPENVFSNLLNFYDEKIQELTNKINEEESKKINFDSNFLQKDKTIERYLKNPKFMEKFNLKKHQENTKKEINQMEAKEKKEVIDVLKKDLEKMKKEKEEFLKQKKDFEVLYNNYDKIKLAYKKKMEELSELEKTDSAKYEEETEKIKERIKNNLNQLNNMFDLNKMKESDEKISNLKKEYNEYHTEMMNKKFKVRTETYSIIKRSYSILGVVFGVIGGVIGGAIGGAIGGVGGALSGIAIGGFGGYALGSCIEGSFE
jgi:hypothetical protein